MFFHDIDYDKLDIGHGDTLTDPLHWYDEPFEAIVSNPPYSIKWDGDGLQLIGVHLCGAEGYAGSGRHC